MLDKNVKTLMYTDSKSLFDTITKLISVTEKRILIDIAAIRDNYTSGDPWYVAYFSSKYNLANFFKERQGKTGLLLKLMPSGRLLHPIRQ